MITNQMLENSFKESHCLWGDKTLRYFYHKAQNSDQTYCEPESPLSGHEECKLTAVQGILAVARSILIEHPSTRALQTSSSDIMEIESDIHCVSGRTERSNNFFALELGTGFVLLKSKERPEWLEQKQANRDDLTTIKALITELYLGSSSQTLGVNRLTSKELRMINALAGTAPNNLLKVTNRPEEIKKHLFEVFLKLNHPREVEKDCTGAEITFSFIKRILFKKYKKLAHVNNNDGRAVRKFFYMNYSKIRGHSGVLS